MYQKVHLFGCPQKPWFVFDWKFYLKNAVQKFWVRDKLHFIGITKICGV